MTYIKMHFKELFEQRKELFHQQQVRYQRDAHKEGDVLEELTLQLFDAYGYRIKRHPQEVDYLFGADLQLSWTHEGKQYSVHIDITRNPNKRFTRWLDYQGKDGFTDSCFYGGNLFRACYGLKERNPSGIVYQSPVYVMRIENKWLRDHSQYEQEFLFAVEHLKRIHMESKRPQRASMMIHAPYHLITY